MTADIWEGYLTERDRQVFAAAGYGRPAPLPLRPALLLLHGAPAEPDVLAALGRTARAAGVPVVHVLRCQGGAPTVPDRPQDLVADSAPSDLVIERAAPSAFFDTDLMGHLTLLGADGVVLAGAETSDAVRATALDAFSLNLRSVVVRDACFDRWQTSHAISLFDLDAKHSTLLDSAGLGRWLATLDMSGLHLPPGAA